MKSLTPILKSLFLPPLSPSECSSLTFELFLLSQGASSTQVWSAGKYNSPPGKTTDCKLGRFQCLVHSKPFTPSKTNTWKLEEKETQIQSYIWGREREWKLLQRPNRYSFFIIILSFIILYDIWQWLYYMMYNNVTHIILPFIISYITLNFYH